MKASARCKQESLHRWLKFNAVGVLGFCVQLSALWLFVTAFKIGAFVSTALAVEAAVLHNFAWHHFLTWKDRRAGKWRDSLLRLLAFNATNGSISVAGNLFFVYLIADGHEIPLLTANLLAIAVCSLINYILSDKIVFRMASNER